MSYTKYNVKKHEYIMHKYVYDLHVVNIPKIISYNEKEQIMIMEKINNMNISDFYGEKSHNVPKHIFNEIRNIIKILYDNNIQYPDITGYNFIDCDNKIWIIDFEHATFISPFVVDFINGTNTWNPEFA